MKPISFTSFIILALLSLTTTAVTTPTNITKPRKFVTKLIHHDSVLSPYYNPSATISYRAKRALKSSIARLAYLQSKTTYFGTDDVRSGVIAGESGAQFMANFSIGEPPVPQLLTMDTGSNLLWVQCQPCTDCFEQSSPMFDPSKSSTYANISCNSPLCTAPPKDKCDSLNNCKFRAGYLDGTTVTGNLGTEKLTFESSDEGTTPVPAVVFGCGHATDGYNGQPSGILGLGPQSNISLVTKLGSKFSYCIGNINDPNYTNNQLILGDGTKIEGDSTPLEVFNSLYYLTLESISVGEKRLDIDQQIFKRSSTGSSGVVIDTGTTVTMLTSGAYGPLTDEVKGLLDGHLERVEESDDPSKLCYKGVVTRDLTGFPVVTFHFAGGAELGLDIGSMFQENGPDEFCMAVHDSKLNDLTVIGIMAQQSYNVGYDIAANTISFQRIDCELLEN